MLIRRQTNAVDRGLLWSDEADPRWLHFAFDPHAGQLSGFMVGRVDGGIPTVTPFRYRMPDQQATIQQIEGAACMIFADLARERIYQVGMFESSELKQSQRADEWGAFLAGQPGNNGPGNQAGAQNRPAARLTDFELPSERYAAARPFAKSSGGGLLLSHRQRLTVGARVSGFDALKRVTSARTPFRRPEIPKLNIEQAQVALKAVARPSSLAVAWYAMAEGDVAKYRMQAAQAMPVLAGLIAESQLLSRAVDACEPIQPILVERTGLPKSSVKRIGKLSEPAQSGPIFEQGGMAQGMDALGVNRQRRFTVSGSVGVDRAMRYLAELPPDRTPQTNAEWIAFNDILSGCAIPIANTFDIEVKDILMAAKGNWVDYKATLARAADFEPELFDRRAMALTTIDAIEAVDKFSRGGVLAECLRSIRSTGQPVPPVAAEYLQAAFKVATRLLIGASQNVAATLFEASRRYSGRVNEIERLMSDEARQRAELEGRLARIAVADFTGLTGPWSASNGVHAVCLRSTVMYTDEGAVMHHCVGGYISRGRRMDLFIISFREADGTRLCTLEIRGFEGENAAHAAANIHEVQNRGPHNRRPSDRGLQAAEEYMNGIRNGTIPVNYDEIMQQRALMQEYDNQQRGLARSGMGQGIIRQDPWRVVLEMDWTSDEVTQSIWQEQRYVIGGRVGRSDNPGVIYSEKLAQHLVASMDPKAASILMERAAEARRVAEAQREGERHEAEAGPDEAGGTEPQM